MPRATPPTAAQVSSRRDAIQKLTRLSEQCGSPCVISRDAGVEAVTQAIRTLNERLPSDDERLLLRTVSAQFAKATETKDVLTEEPSQQSGGRKFRVNAADVQLTFNCRTWVPTGQQIEEWFANAGTVLVSRFQSWALDVFPKNFPQKLLHTTLTMEESLQAEQPQVHLHAQFTFDSKVDKCSVEPFMFEHIKPHVETNKARGKDVLV
jgi:hypothetical protein